MLPCYRSIALYINSNPRLAHFLSPDNYVQDPGFTQSYNRYGYCVNNPLKYTDPTGERFTIWHLVAGCMFGALSWSPVINHANGNYNLGQAIGHYFIDAALFLATAGTSTAYTGFEQALYLIYSNVFLHGFAEGFSYAVDGGNFLDGFMQGAMNGLIASAITIGGTIIGNAIKMPYTRYPVEGVPHSYDPSTLAEWINEHISTEDALIAAEEIISASEDIYSEGGWMYYVVENGCNGQQITGHAFAYDPKTEIAYEVHVPNHNSNRPSVFEEVWLWLQGRNDEKTTRYIYYIKQDIYKDYFCKTGSSHRARLTYAIVWIPNKAEALKFFNDPTPWKYNIFTKNCKHYVISGFRAGGANITGVSSKISIRE